MDCGICPLGPFPSDLMVVSMTPLRLNWGVVETQPNSSVLCGVSVYVHSTERPFSLAHQMNFVCL